MYLQELINTLESIRLTRGNLPVGVSLACTDVIEDVSYAGEVDGAVIVCGKNWGSSDLARAQDKELEALRAACAYTNQGEC